MLNSNSSLPNDAIFVLVGVAALLVIYIALCAVRNFVTKRQKPEEAVPISEEENDEETVAAITAAITLILEDEAREDDRKPVPFRVVAFRRTNNRRIGE